MPAITMELAKLPREKKAKLVKTVTDDVVEATGIDAGHIFVFVKENEPDNIGVPTPPSSRG